MNNTAAHHSAQLSVRRGVIEGAYLDGVDIARLRKTRRGVPVRQILGFALAVISFKVFLFFELGAVAYGAKVDQLNQGGLVERVASAVMQLDPVSQYVVNGVRFGAW